MPGLTPAMIDHLSGKDDDELVIEMLQTEPGSPAFEGGLMILRSREMIEGRRMIVWTRAMAIATVIMAAATVLLAVVAV